MRAADYDNDGDLDLFVGGRAEPWAYPKPVSSFIFRNDSKEGVPKFTDVTQTIAPALQHIGLTCDALWTDFDNDGWMDLVLSGEWMPATFLKNTNGRFTNVTEQAGNQNKIGLFSSIAPGDFDNDGDIDYVIGNTGLNSFYRGDEKHPLSIYARDFNGDGTFDAIPTLFLVNKEGTLKEYPAHTLTDLVNVIGDLKTKYPDNKSFTDVTADQLPATGQMKDALVVKANTFTTSLYLNRGNGTFKVIPLPAKAQISNINGMVAEDFDNDSNLDLVLNGNEFGTNINTGRSDALNGLYLKGNGKGGFAAKTVDNSGFYVPGNGKALVKIVGPANKYYLVASQNRASLKAFRYSLPCTLVRLQPNDISAVITYKNGKKQKREFYYGSSYLSQSGRFIKIDDGMSSILVTDSEGKSRAFNL